MYKLKKITKSATPAALERAERYRLLNDSAEAESICLDILDADPTNHEARVMLLLSLTDQFDERLSDAYTEAHDVLEKLEDEYERHYYEGVICERRARAHMRRRSPGAGHVAYEWFHKAMDHYADAEKVRPKDDEHSLLRWNTCARTIMRHRDVEPAPERTAPEMLE